MNSRLFKILTILAVTILAAGCKIAVIVGEGGNVTSSSGTRDCASTKYCINEITDANYTETFTVTDKPGFQFVRWQGGTDFQCGGSTSRTCTVKTKGMTQYGTYYLMPIFLDIGFDTDGDLDFDRTDPDDDNDGVLDRDDDCPLLGPNLDGFGCPAGKLITDTVIVGSREWAQPDLFVNITWTDMNAACPSSNNGVCNEGAVLNGKDLTGWTWAGFRDVALLYSSFGASLPNPPGVIEKLNSEWAPAVYAAGFRHTLTDDFPPTTFRTIYFYLPLDDGIIAGTYAGSQDYVDAESYDYAGNKIDVSGGAGGVGMLLHRPRPQ